MRSLLLLVLLALSGAPAEAQQVSDPTTRELRIVINERDKAYTYRFDAQEKAVAAALAAAEKATQKAETASDKRFESVNEFRDTLKDQQATYITRAEAWAFFIGFSMLMLSMIMYFNKKNQGE